MIRTFLLTCITALILIFTSYSNVNCQENLSFDCNLVAPSQTSILINSEFNSFQPESNSELLLRQLADHNRLKRRIHGSSGFVLGAVGIVEMHVGVARPGRHLQARPARRA